MRLVRLAGVVAVSAAVAGCGVGWPISRSEIGSPPPDAARLVVYRPTGLKLAWRSIDIDVNDAAACGLPRGDGFAMDVAGGGVTVAAHLFGFPGKTSLSLQAEPAKIYYVRVQVSGETSPGAVGGLIGLGVADEVPAGSAPFDLDTTDETTAIASGVKLSRCPR